MKKILLVIIVLSFGQICPATPPVERLSLPTAIEYAEKNNADFQSSKIDVNIAKNNVKSANQLRNPEINTFFNFGKAGHGNPQQIGVSETIEIAKRGARKKLAKSNLELAKNNVEYNRFNLKMDVREAYIDLVTAKSILNSLESQQKLLEELVVIAKKRVAAGAAPEMDVIQAEIALNQMVTQVNTAKVNVKSAMYDFNKVLNPNNPSDIKYDSIDSEFTSKNNFIGLLTPSPKEQLPSFESISQNSLNNRFDLRIAKQQVDVAQKNLVVVARQRVPDLEVGGGYAFQNKHLSEDGTYKNGAYLGVNLTNIPIFYSYRPEIKNAKLEVEKADLNYISTRNKALNDLNSAYEKFVTAKLNLNYYNDKLLKSSDEMIKISKRSYEVGKSNLTTLIVMEQSYRSIIVGYTYALSEYYNCWIDFLREVNTEEFRLNDESV